MEDLEADAEAEVEEEEEMLIEIDGLLYIPNLLLNILISLS